LIVQSFFLADNAYNEAKSVARTLLAAAKHAGNLEDFKEKFASLPDTLGDIDDLIERETAQSELKFDISAKVLDDFADRERALEHLQMTILQLEETFRCKRDAMVAKEQEWVPRVEELVLKLNSQFSRFFKFMQYSGEVRLCKGDEVEGQETQDYDRWGIRILVKFRQEESLHVLNSERQSGGERSVSTILYLLALQEFSIAPFRVVDEINQGKKLVHLELSLDLFTGMDPRNERLVHHLIVNTATLNDTCQYFLVTPKLLTDLYFNEKVKVHTVQNAEWNLDAHALRPIYQRLLRDSIVSSWVK
jgi:structural maintenance of chromosomes protein 5